MLLLKQDTTKKRSVDKTISRVEFKNDGNSKKYEIKAIYNGMVYTSKLKGRLLGLYYLVLWKGYPKEEKYLEIYFNGTKSLHTY